MKSAFAIYTCTRKKKLFKKKNKRRREKRNMIARMEISFAAVYTGE